MIRKRGKPTLIHSNQPISWCVRLDASATAVVDVDVDADLDPDGRQHAVRLRARDDGGREVEVTGERIALVALPLGATVVDEAFFRFRLRGRTGYGVSEHLHRL